MGSTCNTPIQFPSLPTAHCPILSPKQRLRFRLELGKGSPENAAAARITCRTGIPSAAWQGERQKADCRPHGLKPLTFLESSGPQPSWPRAARAQELERARTKGSAPAQAPLALLEMWPRLWPRAATPGLPRMKEIMKEAHAVNLDSSIMLRSQV